MPALSRTFSVTSLLLIGLATLGSGWFYHDSQHWLAGTLSAIFALIFSAQLLLARQAQRALTQPACQLDERRQMRANRQPLSDAALARADHRLAPEIEERRRVEARLNYLVEHDALTGLANRHAALEHVEHSIEAGRALSILLIDVELFWQGNEGQTPRIGDPVLLAVAGRLQQWAPWADCLARLGGDEFLCLREGDDDDAAVSRAAQDILAAFAEPLEIAGQLLPLSASVGICRYPRDGSTVGELLRNADTAMYRAKAGGRGLLRFYEASMTSEAQHRVRLENLMWKAIRKGEFEMLLQPQVDAATGSLCGAEALLCWRSPELGLVLPALFIPLAEENGLIFPLGDWILREACRQVVEWRAAGFALPEVSVNLSARQLAQPDFADEVSGVLEVAGLQPAQLRLELSEAQLTRVDDAPTRLHGLRALGLSLALDDFAAADASLAGLKSLPVQQLKINAALVEGIGRNPGAEESLRTIVGLARSLAWEVVAKGVETAAQAEFLRGVGCHRLQGFLYGPPVSPAAFQATWSKR